MLDPRIISRSTQMTVALALALGFASVGMCHTSITEDVEPTSFESQEEITVYGEKSLVRLRHAIYRAEEDLFSVYNDLNSNDDFDVDCKYVAFPRGRWGHHQCRPRFAIKAEAMATQAVMLGSPHGADLSEYSVNGARIKKKNELLWAEMRALLNEHPELRSALTDLVNAKNRYELELKRR